MLEICQKTQLLLSRQYQNQTLAHAIVIQGRSTLANRALADWLVELLICQKPVTKLSELDEQALVLQACGHCKTCLLNKADNFPDHLNLQSENKTIGVDDIRRGNSFLEKTAHIGQVKTVLIPASDTMTVAASNALLKTLEEPNPNNYIILLTQELDSLLPTIVSRCAVLTIKSEVGQALLNSLQLSMDSKNLYFDNGLNDNAFINSSQLAELTSEDTYHAYQTFTQCYLGYLNNTVEEKQLLDQLNDSEHAIRWLENLTCNLIRKFYLSDIVQQTNFSKQFGIEVSVLKQLYQAIINSNKLIKSYAQVNRQLICQQLLVTINNIIRSST